MEKKFFSFRSAIQNKLSERNTLERLSLEDEGPIPILAREPFADRRRPIQARGSTWLCPVCPKLHFEYLKLFCVEVLTQLSFSQVSASNKSRIFLRRSGIFLEKAEIFNILVKMWSITGRKTRAQKKLFWVPDFQKVNTTDYNDQKISDHPMAQGSVVQKNKVDFRIRAAKLC